MKHRRLCDGKFGYDIKAALLLLIGLLHLMPIGPAQEIRGSISGQVTDKSGGGVPGTQVTVRNQETNTPTSTTTNATGQYTILYLPPGMYSLTVEAAGFKKLIRQGIEVRIGDRLKLDLALEVGGLEETLNVTASAPLLETSTGSSGQVIDGRRISELPLSDGNPFVLSRLATGIGYTGDLKFSRPFDNQGTSSLVADGALGGNEFTLDGTPNMANKTSSGELRVAFVPPADAVQEFKVVTASFDAQQGHTAGANIDVVIKTGTSDLHGTLYEFLRNDVLSANDFFLNRAGQPRDALRYNRFGGSVGGPVLLPKLYNGRDKTFFFFAYEGLRDVFPEPRQETVPTVAERNGDFSALLPAITIYNPFSAQRLTDGRIQRAPFDNNRIPRELISPIAQAYLQFYPLPNQAGDAQGRNNFISPNRRTDTFHSETVRVDHNLTEKHKFFFRYTENNRRESRNNWTGVVNGIRPTGNFLFRINHGGTYDHVYTHSPTTLLNVRVGFSRFNESDVRQHAGAFNPATLGFSQQTIPFFGNASYLPEFRIGEYSGSTQLSGFSRLGDSLGDTTTHNIYSFQPTLSKMNGNHAFRIGYDFRSYRENRLSPGHAAGRYDFATGFTRGPLDTAPFAPLGQDLAAFLLGIPTGGFIDRNAARSNQTVYNAIFFQDDWKVSRRLSLNLGLRYEYEGATTERYNRNVRGFDPTGPSPIEPVVRAVYAAAPIPELPPDNFHVRGGLLFASDSDRGFWKPDKNNFQPRIGVAYQLNEKTVLRGGWGIFTVPFTIDGVHQNGFSQSTNIVPSFDNGLTFRANLFNPFPTGVTDPPGAVQGLLTSIGRDLEFAPVKRLHSKSQRWEFNVQRELPGQWLVEAAYVGNKGYDLTTTTDILNAVPAQYLSTRSIRDQQVINFLTANFPNPFRGLAPDTSLDGNTIQRQQLLRPYPQFNRIRTRRSDGSSIYHSAQFRAEKRFTRGYTLLASYTWSKLIEEIQLRNVTDTAYERVISVNDIPHRLVVSGIWELPFGKGRPWGTNWGGLTDAVLGGWQFQGVWQAQSGRPLAPSDSPNVLANIYYGGDPSQLTATINGNTVNGTFDTSGFYFSDDAVRTNGQIDPTKQRSDSRIRLANNIRTFPSRLPRLRAQSLNLWDLSLIKNIAIRERAKIQFRAEFLNAFNHPQFSNPNLDPTNSNFAKVTSQSNLPRNVQLGLKLTF